MANARALIVGINEVNRAFYGGWSGPSAASLNDASEMKKLAEARGFTVVCPPPQTLRRDTVLTEIASAANALPEGGTFLLYYSGHGAQVEDLNGDEEDDEGQRLDETWCLRDGFIFDDELARALLDFKDDVRVVAISDSCHSGTMTMTAAIQPPPDHHVMPRQRRAVPQNVVDAALAARPQLYKEIRQRKPVDLASARAQVLELSACQSGSDAFAAAQFGFYTGALLDIVANDPTLTYRQLQTKISDRIKASQLPQLRSLGAQSNLADSISFHLQ